MEEKRRGKRLPAELSLEISEVFKQDNIQVEDIKAPIKVVDVSKYGIGFESASTLPLKYYFNARLELGDKDNALNCVVQIVRCQELENGMKHYGCEIVGRASILDFIFDDYEKTLENV